MGFVFEVVFAARKISNFTKQDYLFFPVRISLKLPYINEI